MKTRPTYISPKRLPARIRLLRTKLRGQQRLLQVAKRTGKSADVIADIETMIAQFQLDYDTALNTSTLDS